MSGRSETSHPAVDRASIDDADGRIARRVRRTPVLADGRIAYKLEHTQHSGTFKARGAANAVARAIEDGRIGPAGVIAASGGNHGAAVAWAARASGVAANIFVPTIASPTKVDRLRSYGATVHQVGDVYAESLAASREFARTSNGLEIHAYDDPHVISGAGTCMREFEEQAGPLDLVFVACGGGGLAAGTAAWLDGNATLAVCETTTTNAFAAATGAGRPVDVEVSGVAADALGATAIGTIPWAILSAAPTLSVLVSDDEAVRARRWMWEEFRLLIEHSAAVAVAALRSGRVEVEGKRVGVIVCGANTAFDL